MIIYIRTVPIFQVAWLLPVFQMASHRHFSEGLLTFFFDKRFLYSMESNSKTFNKPSVAILLIESKIILVQTQNGSTSHKNNLYRIFDMQ